VNSIHDSKNVTFVKGLSRTEAAAWVYLETDKTQKEASEIFGVRRDVLCKFLTKNNDKLQQKGNE